MAKQTGELKFTPFGTPIRPVKPTKCDKKFLEQFGVELDTKTGNTIIVHKDPVDLDALIQSYRHECGMELAQTLIQRGLADPNDFYPEAKDYGDTSELPDNLNDAYRESLRAQDAAGSLDLGQFKTEADIQAYVEKYVKEQLEAQKAVAASSNQSVGGSDNA